MLPLYIASAGWLVFGAMPAHGVSPDQPPVPHWVVLLVVVPTLWLCIGGAVLAVDRLFEWVENSTKR